MIDVVWYGDQPNILSRGYWDQGWLEDVLADLPTEHHSAADLPAGHGAVVVVPARWHVGREREVLDFVERLPWCVLVLTGDEENVFDRTLFPPIGDSFRLWVQTPRIGSAREGERYVGDMARPGTHQTVGLMTWDKDTNWMFAGQVNTEERGLLAETLRKRYDGDALLTDTFGSGHSQAEYLSRLTRARVAPCPGGPFTPDTFRLFEALEAGCAPIVPDSDYWDLIGYPVLTKLKTHLPKPKQWKDAIERALGEWPDSATRASAWYQRYKRELRRRFRDDLRELSGEPGVGSPVTVLLLTSSSPADPSLDIIDETMTSVNVNLPDADVIVLMDGLHKSHWSRRKQYAEYRRRVAWSCEHRWRNAYPIHFEQHQHQAAMTRYGLGDVHTPVILFMEHDTPLVGEIPWAELTAAIQGGEADVIRLHHEASVLEPHEHLMLDQESRLLAGAPLRRTVQWSQRPHLANTSLYRRIIAEHFREESKIFIEDVMHSQLEVAWREFGLAGWDRYRLWLYAPEGDMKRSTHLDGRAGEPKVPMIP